MTSYKAASADTVSIHEVIARHAINARFIRLALSWCFLGRQLHAHYRRSMQTVVLSNAPLKFVVPTFFLRRCQQIDGAQFRARYRGHHERGKCPRPRTPWPARGPYRSLSRTCPFLALLPLAVLGTGSLGKQYLRPPGGVAQPRYLNSVSFLSSSFDAPGSWILVPSSSITRLS